MRKWLSVIGDCHSERNAYLHMIRECEYSIQIGDLDFDYDWLVSKGVDVSRHRWLPGNHDNYDLAFASPHCLGDFGTHSVPEFGDVFYVRGAWSIDHMARSAVPRKIGKVLYPKNYWPDLEELSTEQGQAALALYEQVKPEFMITHECPLSIVSCVTNPRVAAQFGYYQSVIATRTNQLLEAMLDKHKPKVWIFGHYHRQWDQKIDQTVFMCIDICRRVDFDKNFLSDLNAQEKQ